MQLTLEVANSVSEFLLRDQLAGNGYLNQIADIRFGVLNGDKIYTSNVYDLQGAVKGSCNPNFTSPDLYGAKEYSGITPVMIARKWCATDMDAEMLRNQNALTLDENEAVIKTISDKLGKEFSNSVMTLFFLGDPSSSNASLNFGPIGVFPQIITAVGAGLTPRRTVASGDTAISILNDVIKNGSAELKGAEDQYILINSKLADKLFDEVVETPWYLQSSKDEQFNGWEVTKFRGKSVIVCPFLDRIMAMAGNALAGKDYVALYTTKSNLRAVTSEDKLGDTVAVKLSTNDQDLNTYALITWAQSSAVVDESMVSIAY